MPTVRFTTGYATQHDDGVEGETRHVSGARAQELVTAGVAEIVRDVPPSTPESAAARPGLEQTTVTRRRTRGGRGSG